MKTPEAAVARKIFLVDDHPLVREWLGNLIAGHEGLEVAGEAEDAPEALAAISCLQPDVAVVDLSLARGSGLELIKDIRSVCPEVAVLVLSMHEEATYAERALRAGAMGFVVKRETARNIIAAIRSVLAGKVFVSDQFAQAVVRRMVVAPGEERSPVEILSDRELEVFEMIGRGIDTKGVAEELHLSLKTVQAYCARIKEKMDLGSAQELLRAAVLWCERRNKVGL